MVKSLKFILLIALVLCGCAEHHEVVVLTGLEAFREGDLVLRSGSGHERREVTEASSYKYENGDKLNNETYTAQ